ncbi:MAG: hypothetical protein CL910_21495 [Deltaproteobacteria bacterium]|nr:hypothetical protein [Deltaproteobacteria bacterium]
MPGFVASAVVALAMLVGGCSLLAVDLPFLGDRDAEPSGARGLDLEETHEDRLRCGAEGRGDCSDWFAIDIERRGVLRVGIETEAAPESGVKPPLRAALLRGETRLRSRGPGGKLRLQRQLEPGPYLVRVWSEEAGPAIEYRIEARLLSFRLRRFALLEIDESGGTVALEIAGGSQHGLRVGMGGNVVEGTRRLGRFRITDVYPEGARAEVQGRLGGPLTPSTEAEVELPPSG